MHKHDWRFLRFADDYLTTNNVVINYGEWFRCSVCGEEKHLGSSIIYIINNHYLYPRSPSTREDNLPKYSLLK